MRLISCLKTALLGGVFFSLAACSIIADWFPDKQKQYRYSSELPDLEIPPDLTATKLDDKDSSASGYSQNGQNAKGKYSSGNESADASTQAKSPSADTPSRAGKKHKPIKHNDTSMTLAENIENAALIEMQEPYEESWNDVGRALGRLRVEITDQNQTDGTYYVYYGGKPPKKSDEETGFWEGITSVFSMDKDQAKEYHVKLEDKEKVTNVYVVDKDGKVISEGPGLELLKRLHKKLITLDQPDTPDTGKEEAKEDAKPAEEAKKP